MVKRQRVVLAVVGLVGLVAWYAYVSILDVRLIHRLRLQEGVVFPASDTWSALRFVLPLVVVVLASVALVQTIRDRPLKAWAVAVLVVLLGPLVARGLPLRSGYLPYYLFSALYLVLALSVRSPGTGKGREPSSSDSRIVS